MWLQKKLKKNQNRIKFHKKNLPNRKNTELRRISKLTEKIEKNQEKPNLEKRINLLLGRLAHYL